MRAGGTSYGYLGALRGPFSVPERRSPGTRVDREDAAHALGSSEDRLRKAEPAARGGRFRCCLRSGAAYDAGRLTFARRIVGSP